MDPHAYRCTRLPNGLAVATAEMPGMTSVCVGLWFGVGGRCEPAALSGISHFIEHLLFKGTRKRSAREISEAVEGVGGYLNAFTDEESTCFFARAAKDRFEHLLEVLMDMFFHSVFDPADIVKERGVIKEELTMYLDQPQHRVQELLNETLWPDQPLGRSLTGTEKTLDAISRRALLGYLEKNYVAHASLVAVAGNITHPRVLRAVKRLCRDFPRGKRPRYAPAYSQQQQPRVRLVSKKLEQTQFALGFRTCSRHDDCRYPLRLLNAILGENMSSRLFQVIREDRGLVYSIHSSLSFFDDVGDLVISAGLESEKLADVIRLVMRELRRLAEAPPTATELRRARDYLIGQLELGLENTETQMIWLGEHILGYNRLFSPDEAKQRLHDVRPGQVRQAARNFFCAHRVNLALVSPLTSADRITRLLE